MSPSTPSAVKRDSMACDTCTCGIRAVIFDLGGVLITSPLKAIQEFENENDIPAGYLNYAMSVYLRNSSAEPNAWAELETGKLRPDQEFYDRWTQDLSSSIAWETFHRVRDLPVTRPPPQPHAETLLRKMIIPEEGGKLIPETFTALKILKRNGIITCGLTNNFIIDDDSPYLPLAQLTSDLLPHFDYFLQSAELGIRKPNLAIFQYALRTIGCAPEECVFLDDIGSNLKAARSLGIRCIRVRLGKEAQAVRELEQILGMNLRNEKARL